jgi:type II secretory pathway pseudopilin PulG
MRVTPNNKGYGLLELTVVLAIFAAWIAYTLSSAEQVELAGMDYLKQQQEAQEMVKRHSKEGKHE